MKREYWNSDKDLFTSLALFHKANWRHIKTSKRKILAAFLKIERVNDREIRPHITETNIWTNHTFKSVVKAKNVQCF